MISGIFEYTRRMSYDHQHNKDTPEEVDANLVEEYRFAAQAGQSPLRVDKFLMDRLPNISRSKIQAAAQKGGILVNQEQVKSNHKVKAGDNVLFYYYKPTLGMELEPENIPLNIVYEDDTIVVINKSAGMVVHPGVGNWSGTLVNGLLYHFQNLPNNNERPGLVHRLDKDTSGLLVIAKTEEALTHLAKQFAEHTIERKYTALVWGEPQDDEGTIEGNIGRHLKDRKRMAVFPPSDDYGKEAKTHYRVLQRMGYVSLVECKLETGRTHQIRVHMSHIGHPVFNDDRYGGDRIVKGTIYSKYKQFVDNCFKVLNRQALHAQSLGFIHPASEGWHFFNSELPDAFQKLIDKWGNYFSYMLRQ